MDEITRVEVEPQQVIGMHKKGLYEEIGNLIPRLYAFAARNQINPIGPPLFVCHEIHPEKIMEAVILMNADIEVAVPIAGKVEGSDNIKSYELPGGKMAKIVHKGPYREVGPSYEKLFDWLLKNGKMITGPTREVFLTYLQEVPEGEQLTEIYAPIKRMGYDK